MRRVGLSALVICYLTISAGVVEARYQGVCRAPGAEGFEANHARAESILSKFGRMSTSDKSQAVVYVERYPATYENDGYSPGGFYAHSNYITPGFSEATKVVDPSMDLVNILGNIYFTNSQLKQLSTFEKEEVRRVYRSRVKFLIHENVFSESGHPLDLRDIQEFYIVDSKGGSLRIVRKEREQKRERRCEPDSPCWDSQKQKVKEICQDNSGGAILMALVQGLFAGLGCKLDKVD